MFGDGALSFREYVMKEPHPLAIVHRAVLDFLKNRDDAALFGAQAVNAYVDESRMTQDVDILSNRAPELAEEIRKFLNDHEEVWTEPINLQKDAKVVIRRGAFMDKEARVVKVTNNKVRVLIESIGYSLVAIVARSNVEVIGKH